MNKENKYYELYKAVLIWDLKSECDNHMSIAHKTSKEEFDKHFKVHLCNFSKFEILCRTLEIHFPEIYDKHTAVINLYNRAKKELKNNFYGKQEVVAE